jgi:hypothetical protein
LLHKLGESFGWRCGCQLPARTVGVDEFVCQRVEPRERARQIASRVGNGVPMGCADHRVAECEISGAWVYGILAGLSREPFVRLPSYDSVSVTIKDHFFFIKGAYE